MEDVGKSAHLVRRKAVYYCRMRCPEHLLREGVPAEKWRSLDTKERKIALERLPAARVEIMAFFQGEVPRPVPSHDIIAPRRARRPDHPDLPILRRDEIEPLAKRYFAQRYADLDLETEEFRAMDIDARSRWQLELEDHLASLDHADEDREDPALSIEIAILRQAGRRCAYNSEPSRLLRSYLRRAMRQLYMLELARMDGDYSDEITDKLFRSDASPLETSAAAASSRPATTVSLGEVVRQLIESDIDGEEHITDKTRDKNKAALAIVERFFGSNCDIATLTGTDCRRFRDIIAKLPPNLTKKSRPSLSLETLARENTDAGNACMSRATQGLYLRCLKRLLGFAKAEGWARENAFPEGLQPRGKKEGREKARHAYSDAQLKAIFSAPIYTGCVNDGRAFSKPLPGNIIRRSRFWLPLIALFSGLRMGEILQLTKWHIQMAPDGLPCFLIGGDMRLKTAPSYRVVPMHDELIRLGLFAFAMSRTADDDLLFDDVGIGTDGYRSSQFSKLYATFQRSLNIEEPGRKVSFHSFRHNFRDALRLPDVNPDLTKEIGGWSRGKEVSDSYGDGARAVVLRPIINRVRYGVDLRHLYVARI